MTFENRVAILKETAHAISQGDTDVFDRVMLRDFYNYSPKDDEATQPEVFGDLMSDIVAAFPDLSVSIGDEREEGDDISFELTMSGTHRTNLWGQPGSGNFGSWTSRAAVRFEGDRFAFHWPSLPMPEVLGALRQVGLMPPPEDMDKPPKHPVSIPEVLIKTLFMGQMADKECSHLDQIQVTDTDVDVCSQCVESGDIWPALRMCLICGFVGCCDTSKNKHMKAHYEETGHALMRSIRLNESWVWCYADNAMFSGKVLEKFRS